MYQVDLLDQFVSLFMFICIDCFVPQHVERETYAQRQSLLEELQVLRQREKELKREADVNARQGKDIMGNQI